MNPLALIWNNYLRWRHSKGFGVHSPFAYNLVTTVVRPGIYGYYGYDDIESAIYEETDNPEGDPALENDARLLLRLAVCLKTERLVLMRCGGQRRGNTLPENCGSLRFFCKTGRHRGLGR